MCRLLVPEGSAETRRNILLARVLDLQTLCSLDRAATMPEQVGYRRSTILTCGLLRRRVRVCRLLVPEGSAETRRNILLARVLDLQTRCSLDRTATMPEQVAIADRRCSRGFYSSSTSTTTSVQALLSAHTSRSGVNRDGQLLEQLTSGHVELWERSAIMRLASGAYF